jgi:single-strand DNA-binding protein
MAKTNQCFVVGNLGGNPMERGHSEKAGPIVGFSIAETVSSFDPQTRTYKSSHTNWFPVVTFGKVAEKVKRSLQKGDRVAVQGKMKVSKYTSKSGEERVSFEIIAEDVALWKSLNAQTSDSPSNESSGELLEDDLPF